MPALVRHGAAGEVAAFPAPADLSDLHVGTRVVVRTARGDELGTLLSVTPDEPDGSEPAEDAPAVLRPATDEDRAAAARQRAACDAAFDDWAGRIRDWGVRDVELIDVDRPLAGDRWILSVLTARGAGPTQLALRAAAEGFGVIEVLPVGADGAVPVQRGGGCGSCGA